MVAMMADDVNKLSSDIATLSRALGRVEASVEEAKSQNADIKDHLRRQDDRTETNKNAAITARNEKEARDEARFKVLDEKSTLTGGRVSVIEKIMDEEVRPVLVWHRDEGSKLGGRLSLLEQAKLREAEDKARLDTLNARKEGMAIGGWRVWAAIGAVGTGLVALLGWLGLDALGALFTRLGEALRGG
jgi:hypothetical protein